MTTINLKMVQTLHADAKAKFSSWTTAYDFARSSHAAYAAALKANKVAASAALLSRDYAHQNIIAVQSDPTTDPSWYPTLKWYLDAANTMMFDLGNQKGVLLTDLAAHLSLSMSPTEASKYASASPEAAAAAADSKTKAAAPNPNARKDASKQDASAPPAETLPDPDVSSSPSWGLWAGLAAGGALLLKILKVW